MNDQLQIQLNELQSLFYNHQHRGFDKSKAFLPGIYAGSVTSGGVSTFLPMGWTCATTGTGAYTVTHNLNTTFYAATVTVLGGNTRAASVVISANSVAINIGNAGSSGGENNAFNFTIITK